MLQHFVLQRQEDLHKGIIEEQQLSSCQDGPLRVTDLVIPARTEKPHTLFARRIGGQSALRSTKLVVVLPLFMQRGERQLWRIFHTDEYCRLDVTDQSKYKCGIIETLWRVGVFLLSSGPSSNCKSTARGI
jgi:hypothetical protein